MSYQHLCAVTAVGALSTQLALLADDRIGHIFLVSLTIGCAVSQHLILGAKVAIVDLIIDKLFFAKISSTMHRSAVADNSVDFSIHKTFAYGGVKSPASKPAAFSGK